MQLNKEGRTITRNDYKMLDNILFEFPTIEAEPVVRCKDCRWGREACGNIECFVDSNMPTEYHGYEWFCPNGERSKNGRRDRG